MITIPTPVDPAFSPPTTTANEEALNAQAEAFVSNLGRIIGQRGTEVSTQMTTTAVDFSELVAEPLKLNGAQFMTAAQAASQGAAHGSQVTAQLATAVTTFKQKISELVTQWNDAAPLFGASPPTPGNIAAAKQLMLDVLNPQATAAHEALLTAADTANSMLTSGPTPTNLQALAAGAGGGSWLTFNLFGAQAGPRPINGIEGGALADHIRDLIVNGKTIPPDLFDTMRQLALDAQSAQHGGAGALSSDEVDYLASLYAGLEQNGMLDQLPEVITTTGSPDHDPMMLGALGGGLLALSNSKSGGGAGMHRLPGSLQGVIERQLGINLGGHTNAMSPTYQIAPMLAAVRDPNLGMQDLEGGTELSAALTLEVAQANHGSSGYFTDTARTDVIDIATRNADANAALLTGGLQNPDFGPQTPEYVVRGVFGHDWQDDGLAASHLIDWIPGAMHGNDPILQQSAADSYMSVFKIMTNEEPSGQWDQPAFALFTDGFGSQGGYDQAPLGVANPRIAEALSHATIPFLDAFADQDDMVPVDPNDPLGPQVEREPEMRHWSSDPAQRRAYFNMDGRANMFELIMSSDSAANSLGEAVYANAYLDALRLPGWNEDEGAGHFGTRTGRLLGFLDSGYDNAHADATEDAKNATDENRQQSAWVRAGSAVGKEVVATVPFLRPAKWGWDLFAREAFEIGKWGPNVTSAENVLFGSSEAPSKGDDGVSLEDMRTRFGYDVVQSLVTRPDSGLTVADLEAMEPHLTKPDPNGQPVLRPLEDLYRGYDAMDRANTDAYSLEDLQESFKRVMGPDSEVDYETYMSILNDQREDFRRNHTNQ